MLISMDEPMKDIMYLQAKAVNNQTEREREARDSSRSSKRR